MERQKVKDLTIHLKDLEKKNKPNPKSVGGPEEEKNGGFGSGMLQRLGRNSEENNVRGTLLVEN